MDDAETGLPPSKKRVAGRELTKENAQQEDTASEQEMGTFKRASEEVLATRRMVKVRRHQPQLDSSSDARPNPFAAIRLTPSSVVSSADIQTAVENTLKKDNDMGTEKIVGVSDEKNVPFNELDDSKAAKNIETNAAGEINNSDTDSDAHNKGESTPDGETNLVVKIDVKETIVVADDVDSSIREEALGKTAEGSKKEDEPNEKVAGQNLEGKSTDNQENSANSTTPFGSFRHLSGNQNAFSGLAKTGFSSSSFSFGSKDGSAFGSDPASSFSFGSLPKDSFSFGVDVRPSLFGANGVLGDGVESGNTCPSFGSGNSNNCSPFGTITASATKSPMPMPEAYVETGEENETAVFNADAVLYEYVDGGWKERGKGELKVNTCVSTIDRARLVMRSKGNYRLILNASLYSDMQFTNMEKRGITFACVNCVTEGNDKLNTFALKFKDSATVEEFREVLAAHTGKKETAVVKTPENSPSPKAN